MNRNKLNKEIIRLKNMIEYCYELNMIRDGIFENIVESFKKIEEELKYEKH